MPATSRAATTLKSLAEAEGRDIGFALATDGGRTSFGFQATHTGSNPAPAGFALNGTACAVV